MSKHAFDPKCPDCRPAILDPATGRMLPPTHPMMAAINRVWDASSFEDQQAFHNVTVKNSRAPDDMKRMEAFMARVEAATAN